MVSRASDILRAGIAPVAAGLVVLAAIVPTVLPGVGFWDTAEAQTVPPILGTMHPTGFPAYVVLGWLGSALLTPVGEPAFRMNLLSAVYVAIGAGLTVVLARRLTGSTLLGTAAGIGLGLTPIAWTIGTHADVHALHLPLVGLLLVLLVEWGFRHDAGDPTAGRWLVAAAGGFGVAAANHSLTLLLPPAIALYVLAVDPDLLRRPRLVLVCLGVLLVTMVALYLELPLRAGPFRAPLVYGQPETWDGFRYIVLAEQFRGSVIDPFGNLIGKVRALGELAAAQFGILAPLLPVAFLAVLRREPRYALLTGVGALTTVFFAASYENADISRYYLVPALIAWSWLAILVATAIDATAALFGAPPGGELDEDPVGGPGRARRQPAAGTAVPALLALALLVPTIGAVPIRAVRLDASREVTAEHWLDAAIEAMEPDAVVVSWWSFSTTLWYAQHIEGRFLDGLVVDDRTRLELDLGEVDDVIDTFLGHRPVYVVRATQDEIDDVGRRYELEYIPGAMMLYRVAGRLGAAR